jgi:short-subunit dehydrogenase
MTSAVKTSLKIIITGSNRGLGLTLAKQLSHQKEKNHELILAIRDLTKTEEITNQIRAINTQI